MKRAFVLSSDCHMRSALVPIDTPDLLKLGSRVYVAHAFDVGHGARVTAGEGGTVDFVDAISGLVEILMDMRHRGLDLWNNHIWLEPYGTEDILGGVLFCEAFPAIRVA